MIQRGLNIVLWSKEGWILHTCRKWKWLRQFRILTLKYAPKLPKIRSQKPRLRSQKPRLCSWNLNYAPKNQDYAPETQITLLKQRLRSWKPKLRSQKPRLRSRNLNYAPKTQDYAPDNLNYAPKNQDYALRKIFPANELPNCQLSTRMLDRHQQSANLGQMPGGILSNYPAGWLHRSTNSSWSSLSQVAIMFSLSRTGSRGPDPRLPPVSRGV